MHDGGDCKLNKMKKELFNDIEIWAKTWDCNCNLLLKTIQLLLLLLKTKAKIRRFFVLLKTPISKDVEQWKSPKNLHMNFFIIGTYIKQDGISGPLHKLFNNYLTNRRQRVVLDGYTAEYSLV